ncbi:hypothetical protein [Shewanella youngdeokensis]|uniref:DUF3899 domain-containing protein n=1 Tax=Shewanella youngdeokensis TaxID=2999068 RepID=A0ABZ0JW35_9GAMM|nr:hypothetical protein RGE70_14425 [Shewanella sp. DAU334]
MLLSFVFYFTGALVILVFTFGKIRYPLAPIFFFEQRKQIKKRRVNGIFTNTSNDPFNTAFIVGVLFYLGLLGVLVWLA